MRTYEEGHGQGIEYKDEQELEEMRGIVRKSDHPICADNHPISAVAVRYDCAHLHRGHNDCRYNTKWNDIKDEARQQPSRRANDHV